MTASRWSIHKPANVSIIFSFVAEFGCCLPLRPAFPARIKLAPERLAALGAVPGARRTGRGLEPGLAEFLRPGKVVIVGNPQLDLEGRDGEGARELFVSERALDAGFFQHVLEQFQFRAFR